MGGQTSLRSYWRNYFESTDCVVWVVDSGDRGRLAQCRLELQRLLREERLMGASLLVFANKQDLPHALSAPHVAQQLHLPQVTSHRWNVFPCSAVAGDNLLPGIQWLLSYVSARLLPTD